MFAINYSRFTIVLLAAFISCIFINPNSFAGKESEVTYYEEVDVLNVGQFSRSEDDTKERLTFNAYGKVFNVEMEINESLINSLSVEQKAEILENSPPYKGVLEDVPDSWVRLTRIGDHYHGVIWDGEEAYILENTATANIQASFLARESGSEQIIYLLSDTIPGDGTCALDSATIEAASDFESFTNNLALQATALSAATSQISISVVGDVEFRNAHANPLSVVVSRMNFVDGIFSDSVKGVNVHLNLSDTLILNNNSGLTSTNASTLINQFLSFTNSPGFNNPGLAHLFTGKNLNGSTIGIAYLGELCTFFGVGVSEVRFNSVTAGLTIAHELGHNFGAPHDNQSGSACSGVVPGQLMNPGINGSDTFSQCSKNQMADDIANAVCIVPIADLTDVTVNVPDNPVVTEIGEPVSFRVEASNVGVNTAENVNLAINLSNGLTSPSFSTDTGTCQTTNPTLIECSLGNMNISSVATITVDATASSSGDLISTATVTSDNDQNPNNDVVNQTVTANVNLEDQFQFTLTPKFVPTIVSSSQGGTVEYTVEVVNLTPNRETVEIYKTLNGAGERRLSRRTLYTGRSTIIRGREYIRNSFPDGNHTIEIRLVTSNGEMTRSFNFTKDIIDISTIGFDVVPLFNPSVLGFTGGTLEYSVDLLNTSASRVITEVFKSINGGPERRLTRATLSAGRGRLVRGRERVLSSFPNGDHTLTITLRMDGQEVSQNINFRKGSVGGSGQIDFVMNPVDLPIILGSRGGNVSYNILVVNNTSDSQLIEVFRTITGPNKNDERRVTRRTLRPGTSSVIKRRDRLSSRDADGSYTIDVRLVTPAGEQTQSFNFDKISN